MVPNASTFILEIELDEWFGLSISLHAILRDTTPHSFAILDGTWYYHCVVCTLTPTRMRSRHGEAPRYICVHLSFDIAPTNSCIPCRTGWPSQGRVGRKMALRLGITHCPYRVRRPRYTGWQRIPWLSHSSDALRFLYQRFRTSLHRSQYAYGNDCG